MIKYCMLFHDKNKFIIVGQFSVNNGALEFGKATIVNDDKFDDVGNVIIEKLNSFQDFDKEVEFRDGFFLENLKKYGYTSYSNFHKKIDFCLVIKIEGEKVTIIPTKKDKYGFVHKPNKSLDCKFIGIEIAQSIRSIYEHSR